MTERLSLPEKKQKRERGMAKIIQSCSIEEKPNVPTPTQEEARLLRRLAILKLLQRKPMRTGEVADHFDVDDRTIRTDMDALRNGIDILGVKVKIDSKAQGGQKHSYKSTVHPIFLALNLSEVLALLNLLEDASQGKFSGNVYKRICNAVYAQLTEYARERLQGKLEKIYDGAEVQNLLEEDTLKKWVEYEQHAYAYLFKSGKYVPAEITSEDGTIIRDVQIMDIRGNKVHVRASDGAEYHVGYGDITIPWHRIDSI